MACVGPCIARESYEVGQEIAAQFFNQTPPPQGTSCRTRKTEKINSIFAGTSYRGLPVQG